MISDGTAQFKVVDQKEDGTDIDALKSEIESVKTALAAVQTAISDAQNFAIIYPNGGTASKPATVSSNKKYTEENPFPGYHIYCIPQIKWSNKWGGAPWIYDSSSSWGIRANQLLPDDKIVVRTGTSGVIAYSTSSGAPFENTSNISSAPCRVLVYKLGKI